MDILFSVGRREGRHSQNRVTDQQVVQTLLNRIPAARGGAGGSLSDNHVNGICGDRLHEAILRFQRMHLGNRADGHVDANGPTIRLLNQLAGQGHAQPMAMPLPPTTPAFVPRLPDGGAVLPGNLVASARQAWANYRNQVRRQLQGNPNLGAISAYLDRVERAAGSEPPMILEFVAFGYAANLSEGGYRMHNAQVLHRGSTIGTSNEGGAVILAPHHANVAGGIIELGAHTLVQILGRYSFQTRRREGAEDTVLENGQLRAHLGRLSGRG